MKRTIPFSHVFHIRHSGRTPSGSILHNLKEFTIMIFSSRLKAPLRPMCNRERLIKPLYRAPVSVEIKKGADQNDTFE